MLPTSIREDLINFGVLLCLPDPPPESEWGHGWRFWWCESVRGRARARASARVPGFIHSLAIVTTYLHSSIYLSFFYDGQQQPAAKQQRVHGLRDDGWLRSLMLIVSVSSTGCQMQRDRHLMEQRSFSHKASAPLIMQAPLNVPNAPDAAGVVGLVPVSTVRKLLFLPSTVAAEWAVRRLASSR